MDTKKYVLMIFTYDNSISSNNIYYMAVVRRDDFENRIAKGRVIRDMILEPIETPPKDGSYFYASYILNRIEKTKYDANNFRLTVIDVDDAARLIIESNLRIINKPYRQVAILGLRLIPNFIMIAPKMNMCLAEKIKMEDTSRHSKEFLSLSTLYNLEFILEKINLDFIVTNFLFNQRLFLDSFVNTALDLMYIGNEDLLRVAVQIEDLGKLRKLTNFDETMDKNIMHFNSTIFGDGLFKDFFEYYQFKKEPSIDVKANKLPKEFEVTMDNLKPIIRVIYSSLLEKVIKDIDLQIPLDGDNLMNYSITFEESFIKRRVPQFKDQDQLDSAFKYLKFYYTAKGFIVTINNSCGNNSMTIYG